MIQLLHLGSVSAEALPRVIQKALIRSPVLCTLPAWHGAAFCVWGFAARFRQFAHAAEANANKTITEGFPDLLSPCAAGDVATV